MLSKRSICSFICPFSSLSPKVYLSFKSKWCADLRPLSSNIKICHFFMFLLVIDHISLILCCYYLKIQWWMLCTWRGFPIKGPYMFCLGEQQCSTESFLSVGDVFGDYENWLCKTLSLTSVASPQLQLNTCETQLGLLNVHCLQHQHGLSVHGFPSSSFLSRK